MTDHAHEQAIRGSYAQENATLRKRVEELEGVINPALEGLERVGWPCRLQELPDLYSKLAAELEISAGSAAMTIRLAQARAEKAEAQLQEAELRYAREFTTRVDFQERAEKAERELAETKLKWARSVGAAAATRKAFQADLDVAHACLGRILGTVRGSNLGYEIEALLEKRRESRG